MNSKVLHLVMGSLYFLGQAILVKASVTQFSENAMVQIGSSVSFTCVANESRSVRWERHLGLGDSKFDIICNGPNVATNFKPRFNVDHKRSGLDSIFVLTIDSVQLDDAGFYSCSEMWRNLRHIVELNVFCKYYSFRKYSSLQRMSVLLLFDDASTAKCP